MYLRIHCGMHTESVLRKTLSYQMGFPTIFTISPKSIVYRNVVCVIFSPWDKVVMVENTLHM